MHQKQKKKKKTAPAKKAVTRKLIASLPKIELHRHLEGAFRLETLIEFARKRKLDNLPINDREAFRQMVQMTENDPADFLTFLSKFRSDWYSTLDDPRRLAYEAVEDAADENVIYFEMRFNPEHYIRQSGFAIEAVIEAVIQGAQEAGSKFNVEMAFLITMNREKLTPQEMVDYIEICKQYQKHGVVGIDLAGDEIHYPPELFADTFANLYEKTGFHSTIHAGEVTGSRTVEVAVTRLNAERIGHGVRAIEDQAVIDLLQERNVVLEQCLTSNLLTGAVKTIKQHPFPDFYRAGVKVTLNTDDPQIQQSDLNDDYALAHKHFGFSVEDFLTINRYSLEASFQPPDKKAALSEILEAGYRDPG